MVEGKIISTEVQDRALLVRVAASLDGVAINQNNIYYNNQLCLEFHYALPSSASEDLDTFIKNITTDIAKRLGDIQNQADLKVTYQATADKIAATLIGTPIAMDTGK